MHFLRYAIIGGAATCAQYSALILIVEAFRFNPAIASGTSALLGALVGYAGNKRLTFISESNTWRSLSRFMITATLGACLNALLVWAVTSCWSIHYMLAQMFATVVVLFFTFNINLRWSFA